MHKRIVLAFGCGVASALMSSAGHSGSGIGVLLANFAMLPLIIVGLAHGTRSTAVASLTGTIALISFSNLLVGGIYGVTIAIPAWLVVRYGLMSRAPQSRALQWYPLGKILAMLTVYGATVLVIAALTHFDTDGGFKGAVANLLGDFFESRIGGSAEVQSALVNRTVNIFPGIAVAGWLLLVVINAVLAQALLGRRGLQTRPTPNYARLDAPEWLYWGLVAAVVLDLFWRRTGRLYRPQSRDRFCGAFFLSWAWSHPSSDEEISCTIHGIERFLYFYNGFGLANVGCGRPRVFEQWAGFRLKYGGLANDVKEEE